MSVEDTKTIARNVPKRADVFDNIYTNWCAWVVRGSRQAIADHTQQKPTSVSRSASIVLLQLTQPDIVRQNETRTPTRAEFLSYPQLNALTPAAANLSSTPTPPDQHRQTSDITVTL